MRIFGKVDNTIDRFDRAQWLTPPFDLAFVVPSVDDTGAFLGKLTVRPAMSGQVTVRPASGGVVSSRMATSGQLEVFAR